MLATAQNPIKGTWSAILKSVKLSAICRLGWSNYPQPYGLALKYHRNWNESASFFELAMRMCRW